jgi:hypothetical protein
MNSAAIAGFIFGTFIILFFIALYFVPTIIAVLRKHRNTGAIVALNALLGWTMIGWVLALVWALMVPNKECAS